MNKGIYLALFISIVLIGTAGWVRATENKNQKLGLIVVPSLPQDLMNYDESGGQLTIQNNDVSPPDLSGTDLIGRQMIADYITLSANGKATNENISSLAQKYVESIPTLIAPERFSLTDLKIIANNQKNLENYAQNVMRIYREYASELLSIEARGNVSTLLISGSGEAASKMSTAYAETAKKLKGVEAPQPVAQLHLNLVNLYLENAAAMNSIATLNADPANAFAGLILMSGNINEEAQLLAEIEQVLTANGI
jgi:hypothetical protein